MRPCTALPLLLPLLAGCSGEPYSVAAVSGRVTLNGKPLDHAGVNFSPLATKGSLAPGPGSYAITDAEGRFSLKVVGTDARGAVVGKHKVSIIVVEEENTADDRPRRNRRPQLPAKYNGNTTLECEVPAKGRDDANFDLKVP